MRKLKWGVIGAGGIADRRTIPGLLLARNAALHSLMSPKMQDARRLLDKYGARRAWDREEELLSDPELEAVYIASPVSEHARQARMAADRGIPVLCEKPLALTADQGQQMAEYFAARGVPLGAGLMMRFASHIRSMKRLIQEGRIGQPVSAYSQFTLWLPDSSGNWRLNPEKSGGGALMDMGIHIIDLMEYVSGLKVTRVAAMNETLTFGYGVEDSSTVLLRLSNGAQCVIQTNFNIPDRAALWRLEFFGTRGRLLGENVIGQNDGGRLTLLSQDSASAYDAVQDHVSHAGTEIEGSFGNLYTRQIEAFSEAVLKGTPPPVSGADAVRAQRILEAAYQSGREGVLVSL